VDGVKGDWGIAGILRTKGEIRQGSRIVPAIDAEREGGGGAGVLCGMGVVALCPPSLSESKEGTRQSSAVVMEGLRRSSMRVGREVLSVGEDPIRPPSAATSPAGAGKAQEGPSADFVGVSFGCAGEEDLKSRWGWKVGLGLASVGACMIGSLCVKRMGGWSGARACVWSLGGGGGIVIGARSRRQGCLAQRTEIAHKACHCAEDLYAEVAEIAEGGEERGRGTCSSCA
jgi:hypothetical protein